MTTRGRKTQTKATVKTPEPKPMWNEWLVELQFTNELAASIPRTEEEIRAMLTHRQPSVAPLNAIPIEELTQQVVGEVSSPLPSEEDEEYVPGWHTFKRDADRGIYAEGRTLRGHLKDCSLQVNSFFPEISAFSAKFKNKVYVVEDQIYLGLHDIDGTVQRFLQVMTRQGPRSGIKYIDYLMAPTMIFHLKVLNDGVMGERQLRTVFEYGALHGMGQERSAGWGRYELRRLIHLPPPGAVGAMAVQEEPEQAALGVR